MKSDIKKEKLESYLARQDDIEFALLFGSTASGRDTPLSDIDVGIYFREDKDILKLAERQIDITCAIMELCKMNRVDVVVLNLANPFLRFQVMQYGRLLYAKDEKIFYRFKAATFGIYQDIKPMYDLHDRLAQMSLKRGING